MESTLSVIVCCYNSAKLLPDTLRFMASQRVANERIWEVIIVDNNSKDDTGKVALAEWQKNGHPAPLLVVREPKPGLSNAREAGIKHASHDLILFCDDDNWLAPDYIERACQLMEQKPEVGIAGGLNTPVSSVALPEWLANFESAYACGPQAEADGEISSERLYITGAGMVIRKKVFAALQKIGFVSQLTDRKGEELSSGGDTEICFVSAMLGYKLYYDSGLQLQHFLEPKRLTWPYFLKLMKGHIQSYYKLLFYKKVYNNEVVPASWVKELWTKSFNFCNRNGLSTLYHYFCKDSNSMGSIGSVNRLWQVEMWKTHFQMRSQYAELVTSIEKISNLIKVANKDVI